MYCTFLYMYMYMYKYMYIAYIVLLCATETLFQ